MLKNIMQLSPRQIEGLSEEGRDSYSRIVTSEARDLRAKFEMAKDLWGLRSYGIGIVIAVGCGFISATGSGQHLLMIFGASVAFLLWHIARLNRRIDALIGLIDLDVVKSGGVKDPDAEEGDFDSKTT